MILKFDLIFSYTRKKKKREESGIDFQRGVEKQRSTRVTIDTRWCIDSSEITIKNNGNLFTNICFPKPYNRVHTEKKEKKYKS